MRRLLPFVLLACLGATPDATRPSAVSITDFGAGQGIDYAPQTRLAFQRAIDSLPADRPGLVTVPPGDWWVDWPIIIDRSDVTIRGDGPASKVSRGVNHEGSVFTVGIRRKPLAPDHITTLAGRPAIRLRADTRLAGFATSLDRGGPAGYPLATGLVIDMLYAFPEGLHGGGFALAGLSHRGDPEPWYLWLSTTEDASRANLRFALAVTTPDHESQSLAYTFAIPIGADPTRLTVQADLDHGKVTAWINRVQVKVDGPPLVPGSRLTPNHRVPFGLAATGPQAWGNGDWWGTPTDLILSGFAVRTCPQYAADQPGTAQRYLNGSPADDATFDQNGAGLCWRLVVPEVPPPDRMLAGMGGWGRWEPVLWLDRVNELTDGASNITFKDLWISAQWYNTGQGISIGQCINFRAMGVRFDGAAHGIGFQRFHLSYPVRISDCDFGGHGSAALDLWGVTGATLDNLLIQGSGASGALVADGSSFRLTGAFISGFGQPEAVFRLINSRAVLIDVGADYEDPHWPSSAYVLAESTGESGNNPPRLTLERFGVGAIGEHAALVRLEGPGKGKATLSGLEANGTVQAPFVSLDGPLWGGSVDEGTTMGGPCYVPSPSSRFGDGTL